VEAWTAFCAGAEITAIVAAAGNIRSMTVPFKSMRAIYPNPWEPEIIQGLGWKIREGTL
jgi:hypothetical protein